jgi:uncharacterized protein YcfJ
MSSSPLFIKTVVTVLAASLMGAAFVPVAFAKEKKKDVSECEAKKKKDAQTGMLVGAAAGAVGGNVVAGKKNKTLGTVAGAVVGGVVGGKLAKDKVKCND